MKLTKTATNFFYLRIIILFISILFCAGSCLKETIPIYLLKPGNKLPAPPGKPGASQIISTDVNPDSVIGDSNAMRSYDLDLNNDGVIDFTFSVSSNKGGSCHGLATFFAAATVSPANGNSILDTSMVVLGLDSLFSIGDTAGSWSSSSSQRVYEFNENTIENGYESSRCRSVHEGLSTGQAKYLGLRLVKNGMAHFGWIEVSVQITNYTGYLIIRGYGYNNIPDQPILAGQTK